LTIKNTSRSLFVLAGLEAHDIGDLKFDEYQEDPISGNVRRPRSVGNANRRVTFSTMFQRCNVDRLKQILTEIKPHYIYIVGQAMMLMAI